MQVFLHEQSTRNILVQVFLKKAETEPEEVFINFRTNNQSFFAFSLKVS